MRTKAFFKIVSGRLVLPLVIGSFMAPSGPSVRVISAADTSRGLKTALDRYVAAPDASYRYELARTIPGKGYATFVLDMTSQTWLTTNEVDRPEWRHWVVVVRPDKVEREEALLFIGGGKNGGEPPKGADDMLTRIALATKSVVAELRMVPNQPLTFRDDGKPRVEDELIAYTWDKFLRTGDEKWPARLPMTKSAVRALDAISAFCRSDAGGGLRVERFVIAGGSKRGWTTWTTGITDRRVIGIVPIVIDCLNVEPSFQHHFRAYGFYAPAVGDYVEMGIMKWQGTAENRALLKIEDPYEYRERLTMPKFLINATGDQFFLPDSWQFYYADLPGQKYLRYVPNADHSLKGSDAPESLAAFYHAVIREQKLPEFSWAVRPDASIAVQANDHPAEVKLWRASNPKARDFRMETLGPAWESAAMTEGKKGEYVAKVEAPSEGWTAFFVELTFSNPNGPAPYKFTTGVKVLPESLPFAYEPPKHPLGSGQ